MLHGRGKGILHIVLPATGPDGSDRRSLIGELVNVKIERHTPLTLFGDLV